MNKIQEVIAIPHYCFKLGLKETSECGAYKRRVYLATTLGGEKATLND